MGTKNSTISVKPMKSIMVQPKPPVKEGPPSKSIPDKVIDLAKTGTFQIAQSTSKNVTKKSSSFVISLIISTIIMTIAMVVIPAIVYLAEDDSYSTWIMFPSTITAIVLSSIAIGMQLACSYKVNEGLNDSCGK